MPKKEKNKKVKPKKSKKGKESKAELDNVRLEEILEDLEEVVDKESFEQFMFSPEELWVPEPSTAPVLEQVEEEQAPGTPIFLEREVMDAPVIPGTEKPDPNQYLSKTSPEGPKYTDMSSIGTMPESIDLESVGVETRQINQEVFHMSELNNSESKSIEMYVPAKGMDINQAGRKDPLKKEDKKYDFKLPNY